MIHEIRTTILTECPVTLDANERDRWRKNVLRASVAYLEDSRYEIPTEPMEVITYVYRPEERLDDVLSTHCPCCGCTIDVSTAGCRGGDCT